MDPKAYVETAIRGFLIDPPDSEFQRGYLAALVTVYREALDGDENLAQSADLLSTPALD